MQRTLKKSLPNKKIYSMNFEGESSKQKNLFHK